MPDPNPNPNTNLHLKQLLFHNPSPNPSPGPDLLIGGRVQRTGAVKLTSIRLRSGLEAPKIKNTGSETAWPPNTTYYGVLMYCLVLPGPTRDHNPLRWGLLGPPLSRVPQGQGPVYTARPRAPIDQEASQASLNWTSRFLVPRGTGQPHKEQHRDANEEDGVEIGMKE